jgi:hypothetical protein
MAFTSSVALTHHFPKPADLDPASPLAFAFISSPFPSHLSSPLRCAHVFTMVNAKLTTLALLGTAPLALAGRLNFMGARRSHLAEYFPELASSPQLHRRGAGEADLTDAKDGFYLTNMYILTYAQIPSELTSCSVHSTARRSQSSSTPAQGMKPIATQTSARRGAHTSI